MSKRKADAQIAAGSEPETLEQDQQAGGSAPQASPLVETDGAGSADGTELEGQPAAESADADGTAESNAGLPDASAETAGQGTLVEAESVDGALEQDQKGSSVSDPGTPDPVAGAIDADHEAEDAEAAIMADPGLFAATAAANAAGYVSGLFKDIREVFDFREFIDMAALARRVGPTITAATLAQELFLKKHKETAELSDAALTVLAVFRNTLVELDGYAKREAERLAAEEAERAKTEAKPVPIEETTLETSGDMFETF